VKYALNGGVIVGTRFTVPRLLLLVCAGACLTALGACAAPAPLPTPTLQPTHTPAPTYTPYPTQPPLPTNTPLPTQPPLPTQTPWPTNTPAPTPSATATATSEPTRAPAPTPVPVVRSLTVEWNNIHYNCQVQCFLKIGAPATQVFAFAYHSFEFNMHVHNLTKDKTLTPFWYSTIVVSDGVTDYPEVAPWRNGVPFGYRNLSRMQDQPPVPPGGEVDFSFGFALPGRTMYAKTVTFTVWGETYALELKSRPDSPGYDFKDCGLTNPRYCPNGMPPWDPGL
jgi:hypothetical protein